MQPVPTARAVLVGVCLCYILNGAVCAAAGPFVAPWRSISGWRYAIPFSVCWYLAMVALFACFGIIGAVYGNILQSTRGLFSILLGAWIGRLGHLHVEQPVARGALARRLLGAALMCLAIWLYGRGG